MNALYQLLSRPVLDWAPQLTLVFFLAVRPWQQYGPPGTFAYMLGRVYRVLLMAGLLVEPIASNPAYWLAIVAVHGLWVMEAYAVADNHKYLEGYWCLAIAIGLATGGADGNRYLMLDARLLIGSCFFFATLWKVLNPRFRDGGFMVQAFLFEPRFTPIALSIGALTSGIRRRHVEARRTVDRGRSVSAQAPVPRRLRMTAVLFAWWTIAIEAAVAALFLLPFPALDFWRTLGLLVFVTTTYVLVPVPGFGNTLLIMLTVSTQDARWRPPILGVAAFLLLVDFTPLVPGRVITWWRHTTRRGVDVAPQ